MTQKVIEGVRATCMGCKKAVQKSGVVMADTKYVFAGYGIEPSGFVFANYAFRDTYVFHPYDGSIPFPCRRINDQEYTQILDKPYNE